MAVRAPRSLARRRLGHGDFLNATRYVHENKSVLGFGSYGDIAIRDRKMYRVPTPFRLAEGIAHHHTLILPADTITDERFVAVGDLTRVEATELVVGYSFDLRTNDLVSQRVRNPGAGTAHRFRAWRLRGDPMDSVTMRGSVADDLPRPPVIRVKCRTPTPNGSPTSCGPFSWSVIGC